MRRVAVALAALLALAACAPSVRSHGCDGPANDHVMLVDRLRCRGMRVDIAGPAQLPGLRGHGTVLVLSGGGVSGEARVESFAYDDTDLGADGRAVAAEDAAKYSGTPHLYRRERVLVVYAGDDRAVIGALSALLGPQFAGR